MLQPGYILREKNTKLSRGINTVRAYICNILVTTKKYFTDHLKELKKVLQKLEKVGLKLNAEKSLFGRTENEYLSLWVSKQGAIYFSSKSEAINKIDIPIKVRDVNRFVGL